jgi:hypothetical protein
VTAALRPGADPIAPFAAIIDGLCAAIAVRAAAERGFAPLAMLLWSWLHRVARRFTTAAARARAGTLPPLRVQVRVRNATPRPSPPRLPRGFAWVLRAVPLARPFASQLEAFLVTPEVAALLAAAPRLARPLRPLCHILGVRPAPLPPPARPAAPRPAAPRPTPTHTAPPARAAIIRRAPATTSPSGLPPKIA